MDKFIPGGIVKLQNFINSTNIERLKESFIKKYFNEEDIPREVDYNKGILTYYDASIDRYVDIKFEDELSKLLWGITNVIKEEIDLSKAKFTNRDRVNFWKMIIKSFDYIKEANHDIISIFPICLNPSEEIKNYLQEKYNFTLESKFQETSYFVIKSNYIRKDLEDLFEFITTQGYLDDEIYSFEDFNSTLFEKETDLTLKFNCKTLILVCLLKELSNLFLDFTTKRISESGRFLTKGGSVVSETNFNATLNRIKNSSNPDIIKIRKFYLRFHS